MHPVLFHLGSFVVPSYGVVAALGVLLALGLAQWTAPRSGLDPETASRHAWNTLVLAVFAGIALSRLVLIGMNLNDLRRHPHWLMAVAMVHHPLLSAVGIAGAVFAVLCYAFWQHIYLRALSDCLAAPVCLGVVAEQLGALLAGSDYGREITNGRHHAIIYSSPLAARWSGTPLGVPLYPVQAYAAMGALLLAILLCLWIYRPHRIGDVAGLSLLGLGTLLFVTEIYRDWEGRGAIFGGLADIPQLVGLALIVCGGLMLVDWTPRTSVS